MPKVITKEYDYTTAGAVSEAGFAVVIPGFVASGTRTLSDGTTVSYGCYDDGTSIFDENGVYECNSKSEFETYVGTVASVNAAVAAKAPTVTEVTDLTQETFWTTYKGEVYIRETNEDKDIGYLKDESYKYTKAETFDGAQTDYVVIHSGYEGNDAVETALNQVGNQMADLLLALGYTVLYKKLSDITDLISEDWWEPLKDRSIYNFRYLVAGLLDDVTTEATETTEATTVVSMTAVHACMADVAANRINWETDAELGDEVGNGRGDCFALLDIAESVYTASTVTTSSAVISALKNAATPLPVVTGIDSASSTGQYTAYVAPTFNYGNLAATDTVAYNGNTKFPASMHYLNCAATSMVNNPEYYAVAGYKRGLGTYEVTSTTVTLGDAAVNALQPRKVSSSTAGKRSSVNLIVKYDDTYYFWGNRTGYELDSEGLVASHFLNIRQLCCTLKKEIYDVCRHLMFDPNSDTLWLNFCNAIRPTLEAMKANEGIEDYSFEQQTTNLKAKLFAAIRIVPIEAVEDFEIGVTLEDSLGETTITIDEHLLN